MKVEVCGPRHLANIIHYLGDSQHPHHEEYQIPAPRPYGELGAGNFASWVEAAVHDVRVAAAQRQSPGRPVRNLATLFIDRFPDGAELTSVEEDEHEIGLIDIIAPDRRVVAYRHRNVLSASIDFNLLVPNFLSLPGSGRSRVRRRARVDPLVGLRRVSRRLVRLLNERRRLAGRPLIPEIISRVRELARHRRGFLLEDALAKAVADRSVRLAELPALLAAAGHRILQIDPDGNRVRVQAAGDSWAVWLQLDDLLDAPERARTQNIPALLCPAAVDARMDFSTERDLHLISLATIAPPSGVNGGLIPPVGDLGKSPRGEAHASRPPRRGGPEPTMGED